MNDKGGVVKTPLLIYMLKASEDFLKKLHAISPNLDVEWTPDLDRWVVWYKDPDGGRHRITECKNEDGSFRPLDDRLINLLKMSDMSAKVNHVSYYLDKQFENAKKERQRQRQKNREEAVLKSRDKSLLWKKAIGNAEKGIFNDRQLGRQIIYNFPTLQNNLKLLKKFGKPYLTGSPHILNP